MTRRSKSRKSSTTTFKYSRTFFAFLKHEHSRQTNTGTDERRGYRRAQLANIFASVFFFFASQDCASLSGKVLIQNNLGEKPRWVEDQNRYLEQEGIETISEEDAALYTACRESPCSGDLVTENANAKPDRDTSTCAGWTLVANVWNPNFAEPYPLKYRQAGRFLLPPDEEVTYDQVSRLSNFVGVIGL